MTEKVVIGYTALLDFWKRRKITVLQQARQYRKNLQTHFRNMEKC